MPPFDARTFFLMFLALASLVFGFAGVGKLAEGPVMYLNSQAFVEDLRGIWHD
jgi:hypothetical protein